MRITARGVGLAVSGAVLVAAGFALGYAELAVLGTAALLALACAALYATWRPRLDVRRAVNPDRVTRGEPSTVTLTVHNSSRLRAATLVAYDRCGPARVPVPLLRLRPGRDTVVRYPVPTTRRGVVPVGPLRVTRSDPLGLVVVARTHGEADRLYVHPRMYPLAAVPAGSTRSLDGRMDRVPHGSITFATLREYVVGDELRHVHWRTSARVGELMVREHVDTSLPRVAVVLDDRLTSWPGARPAPQAAPPQAAVMQTTTAPAAAAQAGTTQAGTTQAGTTQAGTTQAGTTDGFEAACEAAASIVAAAVREDLVVSLHLVCGAPHTGAPHTGTAGLRDAARGRPLLDRLAEATLTSIVDGPDPLQDMTTRLRQRRVGDTLVYLTGGGGLSDLGLVAALRGAYPAVVVGVLGSDGPAPSTVQGVLLLDAADGPEFASAWDGVRSW